MVRMGDKALALGCYVPLGLMLYPPYIPIGHDVCNTYIYIITYRFMACCHVDAKFIVVVYTSYCMGGLRLGLYRGGMVVYRPYRYTFV